MLHGYKDTMMEFFNFLSTVIIIIIMLSIGGLMIQISANAGFTNHAEGIVSRHGGLTTTAVNEIKQHSKDHYGGRYEVLGIIEGIDANGNTVYTIPGAREKYGETVTFEVRGHYQIMFFNLPMELDLTVNAVTRRR